MLKRNSIKTFDHTDSSHYRNKNQLAVWVNLEIFEPFRLKPAIDHEYSWVQFVLKNCEIPYSVRGLYDK